MDYNTVPTILETPEQVSDLFISLSGLDIYKQTRKAEYVEHRALLCHILRNKLDMRWVSISDFIKSKGKAFDHATAIHANKMYPLYKKDRFDYYDKLESNFIVKSQIEYSQISKLEVIQKKYATLEKDYFKAIEKLSKFDGGYTKIEKQYRSLDEEQKTMYDERAALVLKSFEWKQNNSEYEIINFGTCIEFVKSILCLCLRFGFHCIVWEDDYVKSKFWKVYWAIVLLCLIPLIMII